MNLKKAPQHEVLSIDKSGSWGRIEYHHRLACGHTETRKRPSTAPKIACSWCVRAEEKAVELSALALRQEFAEAPLVEPYYDDDAAYDMDAGRLRAGLVSALGLTAESVEVVSEVNEEGELQARYVVVFMDLSTASRLAGFDSDTPQ